MADNEIAKQDDNKALATIPEDLMRDSGKGTESITSDDVRPPRLLVCQSGSPQRKPGDAKQIKGLQELDMFNDLTNEIYGQGPLKIVVVKTLGSRHMQFAPMEEGGGVIDYNVPANDPRTQFTVAEDGTRIKPVATKFYDYLLWLPDYSEIVALSLKSTQLKVAIKINGLLKSPLKVNGRVLMNPPAWARTYSLTTTMERKDSYAWCNFNLSVDGITDPETRELCAAQASMFEGKNVEVPVDHPSADTDDVPF